jgi:hypothetical protein
LEEADNDDDDDEDDDDDDDDDNDDDGSTVGALWGGTAGEVDVTAGDTAPESVAPASLSGMLRSRKILRNSSRCCSVLHCWIGV